MSAVKNGGETGTTRAKNNSDEEFSFIHKFKSQPIYREKIMFTASLCWSFIMLGWVESLLGPTLPDLRLIIGETLDTASWLFTATSGGFLVGSIITGIMQDRLNRLLMLVLVILGTSGTVAAIPWCPYFALMLCVKFVGGMLAASLDTIGNAEVVSTWDKQAAPYMQALHFCFSLGGMIAPLMARPFLATSMSHKHANTTFSFGRHLNSSINMTSEINNLTDSESGAIFSETKVQYAYLITAILISVTSLPFLCMFYMKKDDMRKTKSVKKRTQTSEFDKLTMPKKVLILCLLSLLMIVYCGTEDTFAGFLMTFTISQLQWSKSAGSIATSIHWICFGFARLGAIFIVRFIHTSKLLYMFSFMMVVSFSCLLVATLTGVTPLVWVFVGCSGFSMSVIFPSIFTWTNEHVMPVSGRISALFLMSAALGVMLFPLLFGYTMDNFSPIWFLYLLIGQSVLWILFFTLAIIVTSICITPNPRSLFVEAEENEPMNIGMT